MIPVLVEPDAEADLKVCIREYDALDRRLGTDFRRRFSSVMQMLSEYPHAFRANELSVRWVKMKRFPYKVFYIVEAGLVRVLAVIHAHAHPDVWKPRLGLPGPEDE